MPVFEYTARTESGARIDGTISADTERAALAMLDGRKLFPMKVALQQSGAAGGGPLAGLAGLFGRRISSGSRCRFYRQLADLLKAGLPIMRALTTLERQAGDPKLKPIIEEIRLAIAGGADLGDAMANFPDVFEELELGMIRAGERGGFLEDVLMRLAVFTERAREVQGQITGALVYPALLCCAGVGVVVVMMVFVLPAFATMLEGMGALPLPTKIVMEISNFIRGNFLLLAVVLLAGTAAIVGWSRTPDGRATVDRLKLSLPILGGVMLQVCIARFSRTLGTLLSSGIQIGQALKISADAVGNSVIAGEVRAAAERVRQGETLAAPLADGKRFPPMLVEMIAVGEETGNLDKVLVDAAVGYEREADRSVTLLVRMIEPLVLVVMTGIVLLIALSVILPALSAASNMGRK